MIQQTLLQQLEKRRKALGMSRQVLAKRSHIPVEKVNKILRDQIPSLSNEDNILAISQTLGMCTPKSTSQLLDTMSHMISASEQRNQQAKLKAKRLVRMVQGTSALEGQALSQQALEKMIAKTAESLLKSNRRLWAE